MLELLIFDCEQRSFVSLSIIPELETAISGIGRKLEEKGL